MNICPKCGKKFPNDVVFCYECGIKLVPDAKSLDKERIEEGKNVLHDIIGGEVLRNREFYRRMVDGGILNTPKAWHKIRSTIMDELKNKDLKPSEIDGRISELIEEMGDPKVKGQAQIYHHLPRENCPHCGASIKETDIFCTECGARLLNVESKSYLENDSSNLENNDSITPNKPVISSTQVQNNSLETKLENKFNIDLKGKYWFQCTIEEIKASTFFNEPRRDIDTAYVVLEELYILIIKESVFIKTDMGSRKIFYDNIASIDYDKRGVFHASSSLFINLKSSDTIQLKFIKEKDANELNKRVEDFITNKHQLNVSSVNNNNISNRNNNQTVSKADELVKYAELYKEGFLTKEEFEMKKKELL